MIIDAFIFNNETDILEARLAYLNKYIDYFVIVESNNTFTGKSKELILKKFIEKNFRNLEKKIFIYENESKILNKKDLMYKCQKILKKNSPSIKAVLEMHNKAKFKKDIAINETYQREIINVAINKFIKNKNPIIIVSDVDEIPSISFLKELNTLKEDQLYYADMKQFIYSPSFRLMDKWIGSVAFRKSLLNKFSIYYLRFMIKHEKTFLIKYRIIPNSGWHLTSFGSIKMIKEKISSWGHWELNTFINNKFLSYRIKRCFDIFGRDKRILFQNKNNNMPRSISKIFSNKKYIKEFIKPNLLDYIFNRTIIFLDKFMKMIGLLFKIQ